MPLPWRADHQHEGQFQWKSWYLVKGLNKGGFCQLFQHWQLQRCSGFIHNFKGQIQHSFCLGMSVNIPIQQFQAWFPSKFYADSSCFYEKNGCGKFMNELSSSVSRKSLCDFEDRQIMNHQVTKQICTPRREKLQLVS